MQKADVYNNGQSAGNTFELGWLVGAIDGEGAVGISYRHRGYGDDYRPYVQVTNCDKSFIERTVKAIHNLGIGCYVSHAKANGRRRESWTVVVQGLKRVQPFITIIAPLLCEEKKEKAMLVNEFCESRLSNTWHRTPYTEREREIVKLVAQKNQRGRESHILRDYTLDT